MPRAFTLLASFVLALVPLAAASAADLTATADTNTDTASPNANFGSNGVLAVSSGRITLIQFSPAQVSQAQGARGTLKVRLTLVKNANNGIAVKLVTRAWNEKTVTAATLPSIGAQLDAKILTKADQGQIVTFDVSPALAGWRSNPATNFGVALVPIAPTPNVQLGAREGGAPAVLTIAGPAHQNEITVAPSGGDYADPVTAMDNLHEGDGWCSVQDDQVDEENPATTCTMHIAAGTYIMPKTLVVPLPVKIVGESREETRLVAAKGLPLAVTASTFWGISDLTILNLQDGLDSATGVHFIRNSQLGPANPLTRINIIVGGAKQNIGVETEDDASGQLNDARVSIRGGDIGTGIQAVRPASVVSSTIEVLGAQHALGYRLFESDPFGFGLRNSTIAAHGLSSASAVTLGTNFGANISDSTIIATTANGPAFAIGGNGFSGDNGLTLVNSSVIAISPSNGVAIDLSNWHVPVILDGAQITASTTGVISSGDDFASSAMRSQINAGSIAIQMAGSDTLDVSDSGLRAPKWLVGANGATHFTDSILDGKAQVGSKAPVCARVYDSAYHLLPNTCPL